MKKMWFLLFFYGLVLANRPFYSTDADVKEKGRVELEVGLLEVEFSKEGPFNFPTVVLNCGVGRSFEISGELGGHHGFEGVFPRGVALSDVNLVAKWLARRGALQGEGGVSVALEGGLEFSPGEFSGAGLTAAISGKFRSLTWHFNIGPRLEAGSGYFLGFGLEGPQVLGARTVGEITYEGVEGEEEGYIMVGFVREFRNFSLDFALRRNFTAGVYLVVVGGTFEF